MTISSQARCDHFDATLYSSVLRDGKRFYYGIFSGKFQGKPFNFSFVSLRPAFNHRAELWTCCPDRMGLRHLTGGIALRPTVFLWGLPGQYINYERALEIAGGRPLASPDLRDAVRCAALLLPGGGDMEPRRYGQANTASRGHGRAVPAGAVHYGEKACSGNLPGTAGAERVFRRHTDPGPARPQPGGGSGPAPPGTDSPLSPAGPFRRDLGGEQRPSSGGRPAGAGTAGGPMGHRRHGGGGHPPVPAGVGCPVAPGAAGRPLIPVRSRRWRVPFHRLAGAGWWHRTILEKNCGFPLDRWACPW